MQLYSLAIVKYIRRFVLFIVLSRRIIERIGGAVCTAPHSLITVYACIYVQFRAQYI